MTSIHTSSRAFGSLFGLALGDALGAESEFMSVEEIVRAFPPNGPTAPKGNPIRVTDDTQMTIAVGEALLEVMRDSQSFTAATVEGPLRRAFIAWNESPDNTRAPGITCMNACKKLARGLPWYDATIVTSKGCGANMRVAPVGLLSNVSQGTRAALAQFQAAMTHGHPTGLAAADLTTTTIADLASGGDLAHLLQRLRDYAMKQRSIYHADWLGPLWQRAKASSPEAFIAYGWDECLNILDSLETAVATGDRESDPCLATGEGWIAEEAFATGLLCFLLFPDSPVDAIRRVAVTKGDSDSIACLTGAFAGAYHGSTAWPDKWLEHIEYRERLLSLMPLFVE